MIPEGLWASSNRRPSLIGHHGDRNAEKSREALDANPRIVVLTTYAGDVQAVRALKARAGGYRLKASVHTDLPQRPSPSGSGGYNAPHSWP
jgi:hypothetical protein